MSDPVDLALRATLALFAVGVLITTLEYWAIAASFRDLPPLARTSMSFLPDQVARQAGLAAILSDERKPRLRRAGPTGGELCAGGSSSRPAAPGRMVR